MICCFTKGLNFSERFRHHYTKIFCYDKQHEQFRNIQTLFCCVIKRLTFSEIFSHISEKLNSSVIFSHVSERLNSSETFQTYSEHLRHLQNIFRNDLFGFRKIQTPKNVLRWIQKKSEYFSSYSEFFFHEGYKLTCEPSAQVS